MLLRQTDRDSRVVDFLRHIGMEFLQLDSFGQVRIGSKLQTNHVREILGASHTCIIRPIPQYAAPVLDRAEEMDYRMGHLPPL